MSLFERNISGFTTTDGVSVYIDSKDIIAIEDHGKYRTIICAFVEYEVLEVIEYCLQVFRQNNNYLLS